MRKYFIHKPFFRLLAPPVYGLLIYLLVLLINNNVVQIDTIFNSQEVYICIGLTYLSFESMRVIIILLDRFLPADKSSWRIPVQLLTGIFLSVFLVGMALTLYFRFLIGFSIANTQLFIFLGIYFVSALLYNLLFFSNFYLQKENTLKLNNEQQQREVLEMEMNEFRNDVNPDLLYESLENIIQLMYRNPEKAEEYIDSLAMTYRYMLTNREQELIPIGSEMQAAKSIVHLLNEQYYGQLRLESNLSFSDNTLQLIPGSLPVVIEYIVRNTIITHYEPLVIRIYLEDEEYLTVQCKLNERLLLHHESIRALERLQKSYSLYSDRPLIRVKAYEENYVKLPVLRVSEEVMISE